MGLLVVLVWTMAAEPRPNPTGTQSRPAVRSTSATSLVHSPAPISARRPARRFIRAFLSHEVGRGELAAEKAINAGADRAFARELLSRSPASTRTHPDPAPITVLSVSRLPGRPDLLLVTGDARRRSGPEPFAFLFAHRGGRWLAVAPGE